MPYTTGKDGDGNPMRSMRRCSRRQAATWQNAVALLWSAADSRPVQIKLERQADVWTFRAGDRTVVM
jgi:hypothetical protein